MRRIHEPLASDPIVLAALAARGIDPQNLPDGGGAIADEFRLSGTATLPSILVMETGEAHISWWHPDHIMRYTLDAEGGIATIVGYLVPETVLEGLAGRRLSEAFAFPGADGMRILVAVNSSAFKGDPTDLRMSVEPIRATDPGEPTHPATTEHQR